MATQAERKPAFDSPSIPDRLYFKIGDVARICGLEAYVLRFWETQFPQLKPKKSGTGQRLYRRREVELVLEIKRLVQAEGYTLAGARQALDQAPSGNSPKPDEPSLLVSARSKQPEKTSAAIASVRTELRQIASLLAAPPAPAPLRRRPRFFAGATGELFPS